MEIEIREGAGDDFISWSEPRPPHGIILHYYIRIIESGKETLIKDYNSTTISWDTWRNKWKITTSENVKIQVKIFLFKFTGTTSISTSLRFRQQRK